MKKTFTTLLLSFLLAVSNHLPAQDQYEIYVSSRGTNAVKKYDMSGAYLGDFVTPGSGGLSSTEDILFHPDGSVLVTGFGNSSIKQYDGATGSFLGDFSNGYSLSSPSKLSIGPDSLIYVTQWGNVQNKVVRFELEGSFHDEFTSIGAPKGLGHVWDAEGNFYIALFGTGGSGTVHKFDSLGNDLGTFISSTILQGPTSIWFDADGTMLVEDWTLGNVFRFSSEGEFLEEFLTGMTSPEGIAITPEGNLLIGDWGQDAVHKFGPDGSNLGYFTTGNGLADPNSVKLRTIQLTNVPVKGGMGLSLSVSPNPFIGEVTITLRTVTSSPVTMEVVDMSGRVVDVILDATLDPGRHTVKWAPEGTIAKEVFLVRAQSAGTILTERMIRSR